MRTAPMPTWRSAVLGPFALGARGDRLALVPSRALCPHVKGVRRVCVLADRSVT